MAHWGMVIDLDKCSGCQACVVACKSENNIPFTSPQEANAGRTISWMEMVQIIEGEYPEVRARFIPRPCMHCKKAPCTRVCPVGATYQNEEGIIAQIYPRCIGCRYCTNACPYTVKYFNWRPPEWPEEMRSCLNPDVSVRPKGVVEKCTFCHHRLQRAREQARFEKRALQEKDYQPACAQSCPTSAIYFGDLDDPKSAVSRLRKDGRAFTLLEELGTEPRVTYLAEEKIYGRAVV
jgi:molybdopterin-containing oxidoreductase family iron-sulfur binding subunit